MKRVTVYCFLLGTLILAPQLALAGETHWVGTWGAAMTPLQPPLATTIDTSYSNVTIRNIVHISLGGGQIRLALSNEFNPIALVIGGVHVARCNASGQITAGTDRVVSFGKRFPVKIPSGAVAVSDPIPLAVPSLADLAISIYIPANETADHLSYHAYAMSTNYIALGNALTAPSLPGATHVTSWLTLKRIDVLGATNTSTLVALGDSITDGVKSSPDKNARWTDLLAERLDRSARTANVGLLNEGISGNRLLSLGNPLVGQDALARFDRDVLGQTNVRYLIILIGINDVGRTIKPQKLEDVTDTESLMWGLEQLAIRAHDAGIKIFAGTLTPYRGAIYYTDDGEKIRQALNAFLRRSGRFDAVIDFDKAMRDSQDSSKLNASYDCGDHLHPNDAGNKAMADEVQTALFR